jgi:hypothetical protein
MFETTNQRMLKVCFCFFLAFPVDPTERIWSPLNPSLPVLPDRVKDLPVLFKLLRCDGCDAVMS